MLDLNADIKKSIKATLTELQQQKERYIKKIDEVMRAIQEIETVHSHLHEYDVIVKDVAERSKQIQQADRENKKALADISKELEVLAPKLSQMQDLIAQKDVLVASCQELSKSVQKLRVAKEELADEFESLSDQLTAMKKSNLYKTLKLLDTDDDGFYKKIAQYIVKHVVAQQSGVFGVKDMPLEFYDDEE